MPDHPLIPLNDALVAEIAAAMDLREPNREALLRVADEFGKADGEPFEAVCDIATAVGKTFLAGGIIEYLAHAGVRNIVIVTPGRTILDKTVANFSAGHPKSVLGGMDVVPVVITADNFNTGAVASALHDDSQVKLFVFTVQSLIRPDRSTRRVRKTQEWLGEDLYQYMKAADDLVVLADEHHVYQERAKSFSEAIRDLSAMALIGLTATPAKSDLDKVIYQYPLARAIAERYVKTPVLVGRKDDARDIETQLRDGLLLLEAKQKAADHYAGTTGAAAINAVMFVVTNSINNADAVAEVLRKPSLLGVQYEEQVLVVHSDAPDDVLPRLAAVEEPDSPVRVIVSVSMLKEGWDVKNIYVICSFRPSISDALTEQTLGRGLRLPWGSYTGVELLDTVEVLSHERYSQLLAKAGVLLEGLTDTRAKPVGVPVPTAATPTAGDTVEVHMPAASPGAGAAPPEALPEASQSVGGQYVSAEPADLELVSPSDVPLAVDQAPVTVVITSIDERAADAKAQSTAIAAPVEPVKAIPFPKVMRTVSAWSFSLSTVPDDAFADLGKKLAATGGTNFERKRLDVVADALAPNGYRLVPSDAAQVIAASKVQLALGDARRALRDAILSFDVVTTDKASLNAAGRLADAVVAGAGSEDALAAYLNAAVAASKKIVDSAYRHAPEVIEMSITDGEFAPTRLNTRPVEHNRFGGFSTRVAYGGWLKALHPLNWFDSTPERTLANLLDADDDVAVWARIGRGELAIDWKNGRYSPDFYAQHQARHLLLEVKADNQIASDEVQGKRKAAEDWSRYVTDNGHHGSWRYALIPESVCNTAKTIPAVLKQSGG